MNSAQHEEKDSKIVFEGSEGPSAKLEKRSITGCDRISDFYFIGADFPHHAHVSHGRRVSDGLEVVIKRRNKVVRGEGGVADAKKYNELLKEEQEWRRTTDMLLNLPKSSTIARLHEVLEDAEAYYVVMEKVAGIDLYAALHSDARITVDETTVILYRLLEAVQALHENGCIHRDLKLDNVMLDSPILSRSPYSPPESSDDDLETMAVKLIDLDTIEPFSPKISKRVVGTDQYIAQEAYGGRYSPASDIFSVGVIAFKLISGRFPFLDFKFDDWPGENKVGSIKMREIQDRLKDFNINFDMDPWPELPQAKHLASWMLQCNEVERPTVEQALAHPFFDHVRNKIPSPRR